MSEQTNGIRLAIDDYFSDMDARPSLCHRALAQARGEMKVKKKLSLGIVLTIALVLLAVGAVAAVLLSMRQIVEEKAIPMANEYEGDSYTVEDTNELLQLAKENGIVLSEKTKEQIQKALDKGEGYFKEEMLMAMAKTEFGPAPQTWTLEQQKWFDDVCVAIGFLPENQKAMPTGGEDVKHFIIAAASQHVFDTYDVSAPLSDPDKYKVGVQYINGDADGEYKGMYWSVDYQPRYVEGAEYWVYLRDDGSVLGDVRRPGAEAGARVEQILTGYRRAYGEEFTWDQRVLRSFREAILQATDTNSKAYLGLKRTTFPDIPEGALTREQAHALAAKHVGFDEKLSRSHIFLIGGSPNPVWKVTIIQDPAQWFVEIDCMTGEIKNTQIRDSAQYGWWKRMTPIEVTKDIDSTWVDLSPSVG